MANPVSGGLCDGILLLLAERARQDDKGRCRQYPCVFSVRRLGGEGARTKLCASVGVVRVLLSSAAVQPQGRG